MRDAFLTERDAHFVRDAGFARDARLRRVCGPHRITYHSKAASLITCLQNNLICGIIHLDKLEFVGMCVMDVITHYDLLVDENNDPFRDPPPLQEYMNGWDGELFLESLELSNNKNVLEIGIGTGRIAVKVAPYCMKLTGIDISPKTIERARENLKDYSNICFVCGDFNEYGFVETFDVIYSSLTMMHFKDKKQVILKVAALLNDGGIFCLSIDKNQSEYIDMGTRKVKIYPDTPDNIISLIDASSMNVANVFETDNAYIIVSNK